MRRTNRRVLFVLLLCALASMSGETVFGTEDRADGPQVLEPPTSPSPETPPVGLEGFCPVTLVREKKWVQGDSKLTAIHQNRTYRFAGTDEQAIFVKDPDKFAPLLSGDDLVSWVDGKKREAGNREHGVFYKSHIFLFANEENLQKFSRNPTRYLQGLNGDGEKSPEEDTTEELESSDSPPTSLKVTITVRTGYKQILASMLRRLIARKYQSPFLTVGL